MPTAFAKLSFDLHESLFERLHAVRFVVVIYQSDGVQLLNNLPAESAVFGPCFRGQLQVIDLSRMLGFYARNNVELLGTANFH